MSCSKDSTIKDMLIKGLIRSNMELPGTGPELRLSKYIDRITNLAKSKYKVDMGPLFTINRGLRTIRPGERGIGDTNFTTRIGLLANDAAFEAIDRSKQKEIQDIQNELNRQKYLDHKNFMNEVEKIENEGNYKVDDEGNVLPKINIKC